MRGSADPTKKVKKDIIIALLCVVKLIVVVVKVS